MRFLITGGAGFIGAALANNLVRRGHSVRVLDDLSAGDAGRLDSAVNFTRGDVEDKPKVWRLLNKIDCVYHLAARVSVPESVLYPREYNKTNVSGTVALMEALRDAGIKRVVLASSGAVYGEQRIGAVHEALLPHPASPYAASKLAAESYVRTIGELWNIETVALRIFNCYGPGQSLPPTHPPVIPQFMRQILEDGSLVIYGSGTQTRDYIYVDDVVEALITAATADGINQEVINIGTGVSTTINQLISCLEGVTRKKAKVVVSPSISGGVSNLVANTSKAQEMLDFKPKIMLDKGLALLKERDSHFGS
ncbi:MAG TPA: NAD-dependent epimerase/dehydratase family protein [Anaerolineae bacterium]|nr:NAD-dependent epimerase/dehydratase family protein [Anaerolineae bacterium]MCB0176766.1 NAD-dependent epimerase/dehydratase family protein [Anaerolineae bacterium]MCB0224335.1 NAD-dependent epimerase/dehydratase family protein [Anaerolineae bacterium]MCB9104550.1 NAD-dependent epimerase/dehydratase family protein [Anaerolineales bacterium]HRV95593.1 NAD-dependent epimerase/dehydratase family protein [Anaerolineae bacterium]